jgi:hypothetical protein
MESFWKASGQGFALKPSVAMAQQTSPYASEEKLGAALDTDSKRYFLARWSELPSSKYSYPRLTKLAFLEEPAGKVRTIAIVDWFTQQVLKPTHQWLFRLLRSLPSDCTFEQEGNVRQFAKELIRGGTKDVFSFDLKAATEMIPQQLYIDVLTRFLGVKAATTFMALLVDRWFHWNLGETTQEPIKYRRGQPMGALGSWASMALVHHALLQFAAHTVGQYPFWGYRILGDDIVIGSKEVAEAYSAVCSDLSVPISMPKSLCSNNGTFDFACQIIKGTDNFSPLSLREELSAQDPGKRIETAFRSIRRGLIDLTSGGWFSSYLRHVVCPCVYKDIREARAQKTRDPAVEVVLDETLGSLESPFARLGMPSMPELTGIDYFSAVLPRKTIFRNSFLDLFTNRFGKRTLAQDSAIFEFALDAYAYKARFVQKKFNKVVGPLFEKWNLAIIEQGPLPALYGLLTNQNRHLAPLIVQFKLLERKFQAYRDFTLKHLPDLNYVIGHSEDIRGVYTLSPEGEMVRTIPKDQDTGPWLPDKEEVEFLNGFLPYFERVTEIESLLMANPETVLGVAPPEKDSDILHPSWAQIDRTAKLFSRFGVWSELLERHPSVPDDLGLSMPSDPDWYQTRMDLLNQGTTPSGRLSGSA